MKANVIILNSRDRKQIRQQLENEFGITSLPEKVFFCLNEKERVYITNKASFDIDQESIRTNAFGMYFGTFMRDGFRLSLEGCELLKDQFQEQTINVSLEQRNAWLKGEDVKIDTTQAEQVNTNAYVALFYKEDIIGIGKLKEDTILNYLPKARRLKKVFPEE